MKMRAFLFTALLATGLAFTACGGNTEETSTTTDSSAMAPAPTETPSTSTSTPPPADTTMMDTTGHMDTTTH